MTVRDRTRELFAAVESMQSRGSGAMQAAHLMSRLSENTQNPEQRRLLDSREPRNKSEFARAAAEIGRNISATAGKLERLMRLAKKKSLFDDRPVEIQELTFVIKEDIGQLNGKIKGLESYLKENGAKIGNRHTQEHSSNIVVALQSRLATASNAFKDILEVRTQNLKSQQERRDQLAIGPSSSLKASNFNTDSPLYAPEKKADHAASSPNDGFVAINMPQQELQQLQLVDQSDSYLDSRADAIEGIEKTIADLAGLFQQLTTMISAHDDLVRRIDDNVVDIESNVMGAQDQLVKYMSNISSNRWLMIKIFLVMIIFFLVFALFFA